MIVELPGRHAYNYYDDIRMKAGVLPLIPGLDRLSLDITAGVEVVGRGREVYIRTEVDTPDPKWRRT